MPTADTASTDAQAVHARPGLALTAESLELRYEQRTVATDLSVALPAGKVTAIVGPNACGKSTLLRAMARLLAPKAGRVLLDDRDVRRLSPKELAKRVGLLPQSSTAPGGLTVAELVARGRHPHQRMLQQWSAEDAAAVDRALAATSTAELADRPLAELSGGQRQRAWLALLLAQDTPVLLLDEPTTYLDIAHQLEVLELCHRLNREQGRTVALVLHDLEQACRYADHLVVMRDGTVLAAGAPREIMTEELIARAFGVRALVQENPVTGTPLIVPIASLDEAAGAAAGAASGTAAAAAADAGRGAA
ncbi:ABC transporter ATP-binding protein [Agromyces archimandritae]|uniref:ABC transporter ATP-binding protein n=1 Tax=Agromyces archimandritae TaxID=2781962 RepID=A0A975INU3_9MICO|nr:ABC transporter ATP-binding protein [Agromyces archimandritae]QTX04942.1 ABC transporter ATP-binding protein [Agromyces archimandritae]